MKAHLPQSATGRPSLGLDAGGTGTRWALADAQGRLLDHGVVAPMSGTQLATAEGTAALRASLLALHQATGPVGAVLAGVTGLAESDAVAYAALLSSGLGLPTAAAMAMSDIELAYRATFAPGEGYLVYAGTGSIAACIDEAGQLHRAGGRGSVIDDAGGGYWIARKALQAVWRAEDTEPGAWQRSTLATSLFDHMGGSGWAQSREWIYGASRGELGTLALAVAQAAEAGDTTAAGILQRAGQELARLALALTHRLGPRPVALAGRVFALSGRVETAFRQALPAETSIVRGHPAVHQAAAHMAASLTPRIR
jgi:glucosamine kinase